MEIPLSILTRIKVGQPGVVLAAERLIVVPRTLHSPETQLIRVTRIRVARLIPRPLADAKRTSVRWRRIIADSSLNGDAGTATTRTLAPMGPIAPAPVDRIRQIINLDALLLVTPLVIPTASTSGCRLQLRHTVIVDLAPELRANLVHSRAHSHMFVGGVELEATLILRLVHGSRWHISVLVR